MTKKPKTLSALKSSSEILGKVMAKYYDEMLLDIFAGNNLAETFVGKIIGYRKTKVPIYLTIPIPRITRDYDNDSEYGTGEFRGFLISFEKVNLFRIGTKTEKQAIYRKQKGKTISFKRYGESK
mgnify:CR=1 FL=1